MDMSNRAGEPSVGMIPRITGAYLFAGLLVRVRGFGRALPSPAPIGETGESGQPEKTSVWRFDRRVRQFQPCSIANQEQTDPEFDTHRGEMSACDLTRSHVTPP